jgi:xanthine/uracil permease
LVIFAFQQLPVMFPAIVTVALLTGFYVSTTIFASGLATLAGYANGAASDKVWIAALVTLFAMIACSA